MHDPSPAGRRAVLIVSVGVLIAVAVGFVAFHVSPAQANKHHRRQLVEQYLRDHANEPGSVDIQAVKYGGRFTDNDGSTAQHVLVEFRQQNAMGAKQFTKIILKITDDQHVSHGSYEVLMLRAGRGSDYSPDPNGPRR